METKYKSPNYDERGVPVEMLVLHYTDTLSAQDAIDILVSPERKVSAHYVLAEDGTLYNLVDESKRAWHAGVSYWRGRENVNACSIGIEIVNPGHMHGYREFTKAQYDILVPLCQRIKAEYNIKNIDIVAHSDIAPDRKKDPGELFDWKLLAENGVGFHSQCHSRAGGNLSHGKKIPACAGMTLTDLGYKEHNVASITAFQRHWRQNLVNGVWDDECGWILNSIFQQLD